MLPELEALLQDAGFSDVLVERDGPRVFSMGRRRSPKKPD